MEDRRDALSVPSLGAVLTGVASASTTASLAAVSMADVMKQFDANGNLLVGTAVTPSSLTQSLNLPGIQDPIKNGFLASSGK